MEKKIGVLAFQKVAKTGNIGGKKSSGRRYQLSLISMVCFPHMFLLHIRKTYRGNWKTYVEFVALRIIQSEDRSWRLIAIADSTGAWEYTKSCMLSVCSYCKRINKLINIMNIKKKNAEKLKMIEEQTEKLMLGAAFSSHV